MDQPLSFEEFRARVEVAYRAFAAIGMVHKPTPRLKDVFVVGDKLMFVDMAFAYRPEMDHPHVFTSPIVKLCMEYLAWRGHL